MKKITSIPLLISSVSLIAFNLIYAHGLLGITSLGEVDRYLQLALICLAMVMLLVSLIGGLAAKNERGIRIGAGLGLILSGIVFTYFGIHIFSVVELETGLRALYSPTSQVLTAYLSYVVIVSFTTSFRKVHSILAGCIALVSVAELGLISFVSINRGTYMDILSYVLYALIIAFLIMHIVFGKKKKAKVTKMVFEQ